MKTNLVLVGLIDNYTKEIANSLAIDFEMYFADVDEIIQYYLFNPESEIEQKCGKEYLNKLRSKTVKEVGSFENSLIYMPFGLFLTENNINSVNHYGTIIFLDFSKKIFENLIKNEKDINKQKEMKVQLNVFEERTSILKKYSNLSIKISKYDERTFKKVKLCIEKYFL